MSQNGVFIPALGLTADHLLDVIHSCMDYEWYMQMKRDGDLVEWLKFCIYSYQHVLAQNILYDRDRETEKTRLGCPRNRCASSCGRRWSLFGTI